jgi:hypothetical protein
MGIFSEIDVEQESRNELQLETTEQPQISLVESPPPVEPASEAEPAEPQPSADSQDKEATPAEDKDEDEDTKRKEHEAAEAKRKAEWEARQQKKKAAMQEKLDRLAAMSDDEVMFASMKQVSADTEKLTRRNMKDCVSEHIQTLCLDNPTFARKVMHPSKSMVHCFQYINEKAWEYIQDELKASGIQPGPGAQGYGSDVPDDLCYGWAVEYFNDPDAEVDKEKEEKFVPQPYYGKTSKSRSKNKSKKGAAPKKTEPPKPAPKPAESSGQLSMIDFMALEGKAG